MTSWYTSTVINFQKNPSFWTFKSAQIKNMSFLVLNTETFFFSITKSFSLSIQSSRKPNRYQKFSTFQFATISDSIVIKFVNLNGTRIINTLSLVVRKDIAYCGSTKIKKLQTLSRTFKSQNYLTGGKNVLSDATLSFSIAHTLILLQGSWNW